MNSLSNDLNENDDETCPICMDVIPEDNMGVTACGHIYCYDCLQMVLQRSNKCPYCKQDINQNNTYLINIKDDKDEKDDKCTDIVIKDKKELTNKIGTKLSNLIFYLKENNNHTIIFSQWDDLLVKIGKVLTKHGIKNVFCKGNCFQRDKAIRTFNENDSIKVIMLSSESAASGTNLTKAKTVIFIDPIYGDIKYRKDTENQAIGRAHRLGQKESINVVQFIIKDTVEEEIYNQNKNDDENNECI